MAIRDAARRYKKRIHAKPREYSRYRLEELSSLTGLSIVVVKKELASLKRASLLSFSETAIVIQQDMRAEASVLLANLSGKRSPRRPIPVPRSVLRFLARSPRQSIVKTAIAYIARGLTIDRKSGEVRGVGTVKASWIAKVMGLSLRSVRAARKELISSGLITKDTSSFQRKLNRDGAYFRLNLEWSDHKTTSREVIPCLLVKGSDSRRFSPPIPKTSAIFAPPIKDKKTSIESKYQKAQSAESPGVFKTEGGGGEPRLLNITLHDLQSYHRTEKLYRQAAKAGWLKTSDSSFLSFLAAAIRAKTQKEGDPVRIFVGIVKQKLFHHITQSEEERARAAIAKYRYREPMVQDLNNLLFRTSHCPGIV